MDLGSDKVGASSELAGNEPKISLHALTRSLNPKTMQIKGTIKGQQVVLLIYSSRTHNFMDPMVARRGRLGVTRADKVQVKVANEELLASARSYEIVRIGIRGE